LGERQGSYRQLIRSLRHAALPANPPTSRVLNGVNLEKLTQGCFNLGSDPSEWRICAACGEFVEQGEAYTLVRLGPGSNPSERLRAREGKEYKAVKAPVHWACATGEE
jgi:hypothetical protein